MKITIGPVEWESIKASPSQLARVAHLAADPETRAAWGGALLGLSHPAPPWGKMPSGSGTAVEYGDRVVDALCADCVSPEATYKRIRQISETAAALFSSSTNGPAEATISETADFSAAPGAGSGSGSA